jgi:hypothetical protein
VHRWRFAGEGAALPDLSIARIDDGHAQLIWQPDREGPSTRFERVLFQDGGQAVVEIDALRSSLADFVLGVLARLRAAAPAAVRTIDLENAWRMAADPAAPGGAARALAARLGLLWDDAAASTLMRIGRLASEPLPLVVERLLDVATLPTLDSVIEEGSAIAAACATTGSAPEDWEVLWRGIDRTPARSPSRQPWQQGWDAARRLRRALGTADDAPLEVADLSMRLGPIEKPLGLAAVDAVVAWEGGKRPLRASLPLRGHRARFALARDLHPLLFGPPPHSPHVAVHSRMIIGSAAVANAFAAELLAPVAGIVRLLGGRRVVERLELDEIAQELGDAPPACVSHQVENHSLARVA